jgi:hypothetical protein
MFKRTLTLTAFFLFFSLLIHAQKDFVNGYIVTNNNDTVYGLINLTSNAQNSKICIFNNTKEQSLQNYSANEIRAYQTVTNKYYVSKEVKVDGIKEKVFLEYLVDGIADLYYLKDQTREYFFIQKDTLLVPLSNKELTVSQKGDGIDSGDKTFSGNSNMYKGTLNYIFQDGPGISSEIAKTRFDYKSLINLTKDYHKSVCKDYDCIDYTKNTRSNIYFEPYAGIINTWMGLKTSDDHEHSLKPYVGFQVRYQSIKRTSPFSFLVGFSLSHDTIGGFYHNDLYYWGSTKLFKIQTEYTILRVPLTVDYLFTKKRLQPFASFSYVNVLLLNKDYEVMRTEQGEPVLEEHCYLRSYEFGLSLGLGIKYNFENGSYFIIRNQGEMRFPSANLRFALDYLRTKSWLINVGYGFRL